MTEVDVLAKQEAIEKWVMPESLHLPVAARDKTAIAKYVGEIVETLSSTSSDSAFLVHVEPPKEINQKLLIWQLPKSDVLHKTMQVWVHVDISTI